MWQQVSRLVPTGSRSLCIAVVTVIAMPEPASAIPTYQIVDLGDLGGDFARARAINDSGGIIGESLIPVAGSIEHAFRWNGENLLDLGSLGGLRSRALDIGDNGRVAGGAQDAAGLTWPTVWDVNGVASALPTLGTNGGAAWAVGILDILAGYSFLTPSVYHAALWEGDHATDLGTLGGTLSVAYDINSGTIVAGAAQNAAGEQRATLWSMSGIADLGLLPGGDWNTARAINDSGQVILWGVPDGQSKNRAVIWGGGVADVPLDLGTFGGDESWAYAINNPGNVVGWAELADGNYHAFLWDGTANVDLGTLGGLFSAAYGINDDGVIVGYAQDASGQTHAVAWYPVPEPAGCAILGIMCAWIMACSRRSRAPGVRC